MLLSHFSYSFELHNCQVLWVIKDEVIGNNFFDKGAATFFLPFLESDTPISEKQLKFMEKSKKVIKYGTEVLAVTKEHGQYFCSC